MMQSYRPSSENLEPRPLQLEVMIWGLALLLGRASVLGSLFPFGMSFQATLIAREVPSRTRLGAAAATIVGALSLGSWPLGIQALVAQALLESWVRYGGRTAITRSAGPAAVAGLALFVGGLSRFALEGFSDYRLIAVIFQSGFVALLFPVFSLGLAPLSHPRRLRATTIEEVISCGALIASALIGLHGLKPFGVDLQIILSSMMIMIAASLGGAPLAAAVGAIFGVVCGISAGISPSTIASLAVAGLLSGVFKDLGKAGIGFGFLLGQVIVGYHSGSASEFTGLLRDTLLALGWYLITPRHGTEALARLLGGISPILGQEHSPELALRDSTSRRLREMAQVFSELGRTFEQAAPAGELSAAAAGSKVSPLYGAIADRVCQSCNLQKTCWEKDFYRTYQNLRDLWSQARTSGRAGPGIPIEEMRRTCIRPNELLATVNHFHELYRLNSYWENRLSEGRGIVSSQLRGVAQVIERLAEEAVYNFSPPPDRRRRPKLDYLVGVSKASKSGTLVSGDSYLVKPLEGSRLLVAVSDGMGAGPKAAMESRATLSLLERLVETGFGSAVAIHTINSILLLRSSEENFATMDLAIVDLLSGSAEFIKIGASPSFLKRGEKVNVIKAASLPVGILNQIEIETARFELKNGDLLVLATDGFFYSRGDRGSESWMADFLVRAPQTEPQVITESLLAKAIDAHGGEVPDDMTVVAVKITEQVEQGQGAAGLARVRWRDQGELSG